MARLETDRPSFWLVRVRHDQSRVRIDRQMQLALATAGCHPMLFLLPLARAVGFSLVPPTSTSSGPSSNGSRPIASRSLLRAPAQGGAIMNRQR